MTDASGDFLLIKGFNGASRNPYHTFTVLELRIDGRTLLRGYRNQAQARLDGLVEPHIAMDAALRACDVTGGTAAVTAEVPDAAFCNWRRTLAQRTGRYALFVDDLTFRSGGEGMEVEILFETERPATVSTDGYATFDAHADGGDEKAAKAGVWSADALRTTCRDRVIRMAWHGAVRAGDRRVYFSLVGMEPEGCFRLSDSAAALALPGPALATAGGYAGVEGELVILAGDHLYGRGVTKVGLAGTLLKAGAPVDADWDFETGELNFVTTSETQVVVALGPHPPPIPLPLPVGEGGGNSRLPNGDGG